MSTPLKPWCRVWAGGIHGTGAVELTDYVAAGLTISGGASKPFDRPDACVAAFEVVTTTTDTLSRPQLGDEVFIVGGPPHYNDAWQWEDDNGVHFWRLFFGLITDVAEQQLEPDGLTVWTVNAVDPVGLLAQVQVGDDPWPTELISARLGNVSAAIDTALGEPWWWTLYTSWIATYPLATSSQSGVFYRDVDNVNALQLVYDYADSINLAVPFVFPGYMYPGTTESLASWTTPVYLSSRLRRGDMLDDDPALVPVQWVKYGPRTLYSRATAVTQWDVTYGPANESQLVTNTTVGTAAYGPDGDQGRYLRYDFTTTSTASTEPAAGQALYYDGTDTGSDDPARLRIHRTDHYGFDNTLRLRNVIATPYANVYNAAYTTNRAYYLQSGSIEATDYFDIPVTDTTAGWYPTTYSAARMYVPYQWPTFTHTAADTTVTAGRRRTRTLRTEDIEHIHARRLAAEALEGSRNLEATVDQLQVLQLPGMDYATVSGTDVCYEKLWRKLPQLIAGGGGWAGMVLADYTTGTAADPTYYYSLGGTLVAAQDGWVATLAVVDAAAYNGFYRPDMYCRTRLDEVTLT